MDADFGHDDDRPSITEVRTNLYEEMTRKLRDLNDRVSRMRRVLADSDRPPPTSDPDPAEDATVSPLPRPTSVH